MTDIIEMDKTTLDQARKESWYSIFGAGGDLQEWVTGYERELAEKGIGKPKAWYSATGGAINQYLKPTEDKDWLQHDLTVLMFPLDGLDVGKLALFKLVWRDRWFDDFVDNTRSRSI